MLRSNPNGPGTQKRKYTVSYFNVAEVQISATPIVFIHSFIWEVLSDI